MHKTYTLTLNERQAEILAGALDLYSRIGIGQFEEIIQIYEAGTGFKGTSAKLVAARRLVEDAKHELTGFHPNASHGIHSKAVSDVFRIAYDIKQVIRNRLALDRTPVGDPSRVRFDTPLKTGEEPLAAIQSEES